jgi:hypothetical protein
MNRWMKSSLAMIVMAALCAPAFAQQDGVRRGPPNRDDGPPPPMEPRGPDGPRGGGPRGGPRGGGGGGHRPPIDDGEGHGGMSMEPPEMKFVRLFRGYLDLVQQMTDLASDPSASGVSAVMSASDILKARSNNDAIAFLANILPSVKDATVQRAIRLQLVDLYKNSNQHDKALEQLKLLIAPPPAEQSP